MSRSSPMSQRTATAVPPAASIVARCRGSCRQAARSLAIAARRAHDRRAEPGQPDREPLADPARRAGDDRRRGRRDRGASATRQTVVSRRLARILCRMLTVSSTAANVSMPTALRSEPPSSGRRFGDARRDLHHASPWRRPRRRARPRRSPSCGRASANSAAGTRWNAVHTCERHSSAWISAATEPCGGSTALNSLPFFTRLFAIDTTILPCSRSACSCTVGIAESACTARITTGASHAHALSHGCRFGDAVAPLRLELGDRSAWPCRRPVSRTAPRARRSRAGPPSPLPAGPVAPRIPIRIGGSYETTRVRRTRRQHSPGIARARVTPSRSDGITRCSRRRRGRGARRRGRCGLRSGTRRRGAARSPSRGRRRARTPGCRRGARRAARAAVATRSSVSTPALTRSVSGGLPSRLISGRVISIAMSLGVSSRPSTRAFTTTIASGVEQLAVLQHRLREHHHLDRRPRGPRARTSP